MGIVYGLQCEMIISNEFGCFAWEPSKLRRIGSLAQWRFHVPLCKIPIKNCIRVVSSKLLFETGKGR